MIKEKNKFGLKKWNKRGQVESIIIFFFLVIAIFIASIIVLRLTNTIITPFSQMLNNTGMPGSQQASAVVSNVQTRFAGVWDWVVVLLFLFNVLILFISAFLIDIHPAFAIIYIIAVIFLFVFGNSMLYVLDNVWNTFASDLEASQTPLQQFIINNFNVIMLGIVFLTGLIAYAKFKFFSGMGTGGNY